MLEDKIQDPSKCLFWFTLRSDVVDQRSGDGRLSGRYEVFTVYRRAFSFARKDSILRKIIRNSHFKKKVNLEELESQKEDRFLSGRQIAFMIHDYFRITGAHDTDLDYADLFTITLRNDDIQEFDTR